MTAGQVRHDVTKAQQVEAIAKVLTAIDADAVLIVEAPNTGKKRQNTVRALQAFAEAFDLRARLMRSWGLPTTRIRNWLCFYMTETF